MAARGYQIIWLAHRYMLVEQAASVFYKLAPVIKEGTNNPPETFKMICVSSEHSSAKAIDKDDDLIISMVQSLSRNTKRLKKKLGKKVIIVVDEAHHTLAPTYRLIINEIRKKVPDSKLLGLTATPIRHNDKATAALGKIFQDKIIFSMPMSKLIANGTLSKPIPNTIQTNLDIETIINEKEIGQIQKMGEMPESLVDKIARTNERNDLIVDEYVKNKDKYGKTLIFALNGIHCMALDDALRAKGIKSGFVYTLNKNNREVIERFRDNNRPDHIDVLININILTEGSDIPDIQTVFLTRPTSSDALLMQMVGRGMRGIGAGGTETVNIVDFCDKWSDITRWLNPQIIFGEESEIPEPVYGPRRDYILVPWDLIRAIMKGISYKGTGVLKRDTVLPVGWYNIIDENGNDEQILVFENQEFGFEVLQNDLESSLSEVEEKINNGEILADEYFNDFGVAPTEDELRDLVSYYKLENNFPELQTLRGCGKGDIIDDEAKNFKNNSQTSLDDFYKSALQNGLEYHLETKRGLIPAGLIEEIRALAMPPINWNVELGKWFEIYFPPLEPKRTYARPSRRQGSTPEVPRPRYISTEIKNFSRTFGVVIDTSGSMTAKMIGYALGAVASYSVAKNVS